MSAAADERGAARAEPGTPEPASTLISGALVVTMDAQRRIITDGAIALRGDRIAAVGPTREIEARFEARERVDGRRFIATPGFIDAHIHVTGDPLTRGYVPDDIDAEFNEKLTRWVIPRFEAQTPEDEHLSAQLAALQMLRSGTTCFLEAGTIRHLDAVVEGLQDSGIRARVGTWVEGRDRQPGGTVGTAIDRAIRALEEEVARYPVNGARVAAWPILIGHNTNPDEVWQAAKRLADANAIGVSAHMSPFKTDPDWYLQHCGRRPIEHLARLGVLGPNVALTHVTQLSAHEAALLAESDTNTVFCPLSALKGAFGVSSAGRFPELRAAGVTVALGTDGDTPDLMQKIPLAAGIFKDARQDVRVFPAHEALTMAFACGARLLQMPNEIGALAAGRKADLVLHDTDRPEWQPLLNALHQLVWSADGRSVHSVWVDGVRVVENYRCTQLDEHEIFRRARLAAREVLERSGVPNRCAWPVV